MVFGLSLLSSFFFLLSTQGLQPLLLKPWSCVQARDATVAMPQRVQRVDKIMRQLEAGDLKLRVRVLEVTTLSFPEKNLH
jgi:hypothetical protein